MRGSFALPGVEWSVSNTEQCDMSNTSWQKRAGFNFHLLGVNEQSQHTVLHLNRHLVQVVVYVLGGLFCIFVTCLFVMVFAP